MNTVTKYAASVFLGLLFSTSSAAQQGPAADVNVTPVKETVLSPVAWVSGSVVSRNDSQIAAEVSGRLIKLVSLGSEVKKGDIIAQLDDTSLKLTLEEQQARVKNATAKLRFELAEVERKKSLVKRNLVSQTEIEEAQSKRDIASADLAASNAKLAQLKQDITYTQLRAPFDGIIAERLSNQGEYIDSGNAIVRVVETANIEASLYAPLTAYQYLKQSSSLAVRSPLGEGNAPIKAIIPVADTRSHLMEVRLDMSSFDWPIGLNIKAAVATGDSKKVLAIPRDALVLRRNGMTIFKIKADNTAEQLDVSVGIGEGELVEVIGNVRAGDNVVIRGAERLRSGQAVNIKNNNASLVSGKSEANQ